MTDAKPYPKAQQTWSRQKGSRTGAHITCKQCSRPFYVEPNRLRSTIRPKYCSNRCYAKSMERPGTYAALRRVFNVAAKGETACRACGVTGEVLHAHHIIPRSLAPKEARTDLRNLMPLCNSCHQHWHTEGTLPRDLLHADELDYLLNLKATGRNVASFLDWHYPERAYGVTYGR